jgi:hypothetical protein
VASLQQYLSEISRLHELAGLPPPTRTPMVQALVTAYGRSADEVAAPRKCALGYLLVFSGKYYV